MVYLSGARYERIFKLQKKVIRIITLSKYNSHSEPLFKSLKLLKIKDILKPQQLKFIYKLLNKSLPNNFESMYYRYYIHSYNTRSRSDVAVPRLRHAFAKQSIRYDIPTLLNDISTSILNKIDTHSLLGYSQYIKKYIRENYLTDCSILNCAICNNVT